MSICATASFAKRFANNVEFVFIESVPLFDRTLDTRRPVFIAYGTWNIEAVAEAENVCDLMNGEPRVAGKKSAQAAQQPQKLL